MPISSIAAHRADSIFLLPEIPQRAQVVTDIGWHHALRARGVELVDHASDVLVVSDLAALDQRPQEDHVIVDGPRHNDRRLMSAGLVPDRILPLPGNHPRVLFNLEHRYAAAIGLRRSALSHHGSRAFRRRFAGVLAGRGWLPPVGSQMTIGSRRSGPPALIAMGEELGLPRDPQYYLLVGGITLMNRSVFIVPGKGDDVPGFVMKFARVPGQRLECDRDESGLKLAAGAHPVISRAAPRWIGRLEVGGYHASVEQAVPGESLGDIVRTTRSRASRLEAAERVARWLTKVAKKTARAPEALVAESQRLGRDVVPKWIDRGIDPGLANDIHDVPAIFQHGDVNEDNVIVREDGFALIDWEFAIPAGFPLWDLVFFATNVLANVDDAEDRRAEYMARLFAGETPSSPVLFRWVRGMVRELALPPAQVGPIVTLYWINRASQARDEYEQARSIDGTSAELLDQLWPEQAASIWLSHPALGSAWSGWADAPT